MTIVTRTQQARILDTYWQKKYLCGEKTSVIYVVTLIKLIVKTLNRTLFLPVIRVSADSL